VSLRDHPYGLTRAGAPRSHGQHHLPYLHPERRGPDIGTGATPQGPGWG
jgi:hypothetical protein